MTNIRTITKKKITRNQYLLDIIKSAKIGINKDADIVDLMMIGFSKEGEIFFIGQSLAPTNPLTAAGLLDFAKLTVFEAVLDGQIGLEE